MTVAGTSENGMPTCSVIVDDGNGCGEGPIWDASAQKLYWTDCAGQMFYSYDWTRKQRYVALENFEVNGCALTEGGQFVFSNNSGLWLWNGQGAPVLLAAEYRGAKLRLNDCIADPAGRILCGSCFYKPSGEYPLGKLFCAHPDGSVEILDEGFHLANGLGFSGDGSTLYFTDSVARLIYKYSYDVTSGGASDRRVFVQLDNHAGLPDGLTVDAEDFVWSAEWYGSCVCRYDPDGKRERRIGIPAKQVSSIAFGGPELTDLFITSAAQSEPMPVMPPGYDPRSGYFGGALFHANTKIQGRLEHRARIGQSAKLC